MQTIFIIKAIRLYCSGTSVRHGSLSISRILYYFLDVFSFTLSKCFILLVQVSQPSEHFRHVYELLLFEFSVFR